MSEHSINSLCEFLLHAGTDFRLYDIGRGIHPVSSQSFLQLENGIEPAPFPRQGQGWFAVVFWQAIHAQQLDPAKQYIWFLKFPLDEQSKLVSATRDHFLRLIVDALQRDPELKEGLQDNPYVFEPQENVRAQLSARVRADLGLITQEAIAPVLTYIKNPGAADWRTLSQQDVHDACQILVSDSNAMTSLQANWSRLAPAFSEAVLVALESTELPDAFEQFLLEELNQADSQSQQLRLIQALCSTTPRLPVLAMLVNLLNDPKSESLDLLSLIAGRFGHLFTPALLSLFFQRCMNLDAQTGAQNELIKGFFEDLVRIPAIRQDVLRLTKNG